VKVRALVLVTAVGFLSACGVSGPSSTVPFNMTGQLQVKPGSVGFVAKDFIISCSNASDCTLTLNLTSMQPDPLTTVELRIVGFGTTSTGTQDCLLDQPPLVRVPTFQGGPGINTQVSNGRFCAAVIDIGNLHQTQTVTVTGQIPG
jgi:hypothetical protein